MPTSARSGLGLAAAILYASVALYRATLGRFIGGHCRFYPSCSAYAQAALCQQPVTRACWLILGRLGRCHPWHPGGHDPAPK